MRIQDIEVITFKHRSNHCTDSEGHGHPGPEHDATMSLTHISTDEGVDGYCFGGSPGMLGPARQLMVGEDPLDRERIWQRLCRAQRTIGIALHDRHIGVLDGALWDLAGRLSGLPVYKLMGGYRDKVPAYASTMVGDDIPGGLDTPLRVASCQLRACELNEPSPRNNMPLSVTLLFPV